MSDISIGKFNSDSSGGKYLQGGKYQELKRAYQKFLKQAEKSDMQNSLTFKQKKLELLEQLRKAANDESNYADYDMIVDEIDFLKLVISHEEKKASKQTQVDYIPPVQVEKPKTDLASLVSACKNSKGEIDNETRRIVLAFKDSGVTDRSLSRFVDKCRGFDDLIQKETVEALEKLRAADVSPSLIFEAVDENPILASNEIGKIDFSWVDDMLAYKSMDLSERDSLKFARKLNYDYENKQEVFSSVLKLVNAKFDVDKTSSIISSFTVKNKETQKSNLSAKSVNSVINMKQMLSLSHSVERNERKNPINTSGQFILESGDMVFIMKDDKVVELIQTGKQSYNKVLFEYEELASIIENDIIADFVKTYKTPDGNLDQNALRVFSVLRSNGVSYEHLLPLVDASLEEVPANKDAGVKKHFEIDTDKVKDIIALKKAGALSSDILTILDSLAKDENGRNSASDIQNACYLTELIIPGKEVAELLPEVSKDYQVKDFVTDFSSIVDEKRFLLPLVQLTKNINGEFDGNASEILYSLAERFLLKDEGNIPESKFLSLAESVIEKSKAPLVTHVDEKLLDEDIISEEQIEQAKGNVDQNCLNICIAMCRNNETSDNILKALDLCRDEYGYPNESLADIVWDASKQGASFDKIVGLINICKPVNEILDIERAALISDLLDNNCSVDEVIDVAKSLGQD